MHYTSEYNLPTTVPKMMCPKNIVPQESENKSMKISPTKVGNVCCRQIADFETDSSNVSHRIKSRGFSARFQRQTS